MKKPGTQIASYMTCIVILLSTISNLSAAIVERNSGGSWDDITKWEIGGVICNCLPSTSDTVIINTGNVTISNLDVEISGLQIGSLAELTLAVTKDLDIIGDYGIIADGTAIFTGHVTILSDTQTPLDVSGEVYIDNILSIISSQTVNVSGTLTITSESTMRIDSIDDVGVYIGVSGTLNNEGFLNSSLTNGPAVSVSGTFKNIGTCTIVNSSIQGIYVSIFGKVENIGSVVIHHIDLEGIYMEGLWENSGIINVNRIEMDGLVNTGTFNNSGSVFISRSPTYGLSGSGDFTNSGSMQIDSIGLDAIYYSGAIENTGNTVIFDGIGRFGIYLNGGSFDNDGGSLEISDTDSYGIDNANGSIFSNSGSIEIDGSADNGIVNTNSNFDNQMNGILTITNTSLYSIRLTGSGQFTNAGEIRLLDNAHTYSILNESNFVNNKCGKVYCYNQISNSGSMINHSLFYQDYAGTNSNSGTINNNGILNDIHESFSGLLNVNNGYTLGTIPGFHCEGSAIPNVFAGAGTGVLFRTDIYLDKALSNVVGQYDISGNSWTPDSEAAYKDTFYMEIDLLGCVVIGEIRMQNVIAPLWYQDVDTDGYGDINDPGICSISQPVGYVIDKTDCDDTDGNTYPNAPELCDGKDNNCSGAAELSTVTWTGSGDGIKWEDPLNWDGLHVPLTCTNVDIPSTFSVLLGSSAIGEARQVNISATASLNLMASSVLTINGNNNYSTLNNFGILSSSGRILISNSLGAAVSNSGTFQNLDTISINSSSSNAFSNLANGMVDNQGYIEMYGNYPSDVVFNLGSITNTVDGEIKILNNPSMTTGIYNAVVSGSPGQIINNGKISLDGCEYGIRQVGTGPAFLNASQGQVYLVNCNSAAISDGAFDNNGIVDVLMTGSNGMENVTLINSGVININKSVNSGLYLTGTESNSGSINIKNCKQGMELNSASFSNTGIIIIDSISSHGTFIDAASILDNQGKLAFSNIGENAVLAMGNLNNADSMIIRNKILWHAMFLDGGQMTNSPSAYMEIQNTDSTAIFLSSGTFLNEGEIVIDNIAKNGLHTGGASSVNNAGKVTLRKGIIGEGITGSSVAFNNLGTGIISGSGSFLGPIINDKGTISPGESIGEMVINDAYNQVNSTYEVEIAGINGEGIDGGHDIINSNYTILLGGALNLQFTGGFTPSPGDEWIIMRSSGPITGTFGTVTLPTGYCLSLIYGTNDVKVALPGPPTSNWNGSVSQDWFDANNWNEGCVPGPESDVFIQPASLYPLIIGKNAKAKSVYLFPGTQTDVKAGFKIEILGN